jgi:Ca2+-binding EF-hand superfamily protein
MIFNIYDKNRNGVLDETDLMQMINLSNKIPTIQLDIVKISKAMLNEEHTQTN